MKRNCLHSASSAWFSILLLAAVINTSPTTARAELPDVQFDAAYTVACRDVTPAEFAEMNPHERLVEARLQVSTLIQRGSEDDLAEYFYRAVSPRQTIEIIDYLPKTTLAGEIAGNLSIEERKELTAGIGLSLSGISPHALKAGASAELGGKSSKTLRYEKLPPLDSLIASGTIHRGSGVYFKLRPSERTSLEGSKEFVLVMRVPARWRCDYLHVGCQAIGYRRGPVRALDERSDSGRGEFLIALYLAGDEPAKAAAERFAGAQQQLHHVARLHQNEIEKRSSPPLLGRILSGNDDPLPKDWLSQLVFGSETGDGRFVAQLPKPVRDAAHHYLVAKRNVSYLSGP